MTGNICIQPLFPREVIAEKLPDQPDQRRALLRIVTKTKIKNMVCTRQIGKFVANDCDDGTITFQFLQQGSVFCLRLGMGKQKNQSMLIS